MRIENVVALEEVAFDLKIGEEFYEKQSGIYYDFKNNIVTVVAVLDLRQNPNNAFMFLFDRQK